MLAHLRTECDLVYVLYVFDDYTDAEPEPVVREMAAVVMDALRRPHEPRPSGEILLGELTRQCAMFHLVFTTFRPLTSCDVGSGRGRYLESMRSRSSAWSPR